MNQLTNVIKLSVLFLVGVFLAACAGTGTMNSTAASPQKEKLLTQAGFKVKTATTPKQQQQLAALPPNQVSAVKYQGKLYYAYPAGTGNQVYVGRQAQYNTYNQLVQAQISSTQNPPPTLTEVGAGPNHIVVNEFDGFGPLGTDTG